MESLENVLWQRTHREAALHFFPQKYIRIPSNIRRTFDLAYFSNSEKVLAENFAKLIELNEVNK